MKHVTQGKARERRDSKQTIVEQRKRRKRKQGYASESMGKQGKPRASTRELRSPHAIFFKNFWPKVKQEKPKEGKEQPGTEGRVSEGVPGYHSKENAR